MTHLKIDDSAIPFTLRGVDGKMHSLVDYGHRIAVAVVFSCNHCPYVQAWEDRMVAIQSDYADEGFHMIAINANDPNGYPADSFAEMVKRAKAKAFNFPYLIDETQEVAKAYGAERTPEVFLFGPGRTLRYHGAIDDNYARPNEVKYHYLRDAIDAVFEGIRPPFEATPPVGCTIKWR